MTETRVRIPFEAASRIIAARHADFTWRARLSRARGTGHGPAPGCQRRARSRSPASPTRRRAYETLGSSSDRLLPSPRGADRRSRRVSSDALARAPPGRARQCAESPRRPTRKTRGETRGEYRIKSHHKASQAVIRIRGDPKRRILAPGARIRGILRRKKWWTGGELNSRHRDFQSRALPTELPVHWAGRAGEPPEAPPPYQTGQPLSSARRRAGFQRVGVRGARPAEAVRPAGAPRPRARGAPSG